MDFGNRFPETGNPEEIMVYLGELRGMLNSLDKEILRIAKEAVSEHEALWHNT